MTLATAAAVVPAPRLPEEGAPEAWKVVERAKAGDREAFAEIYRENYDKVFTFVHWRVRGRELAEDLTSETFVRALSRIDSVTWQGRHIAAWLITVARNLIADYFKSGRYRLEIAARDIVEAAGDRAEWGIEGTPEAAAVDHLTHLAVLRAVQQMESPLQRQCVILRFLEGRSVGETAALMGQTEGGVKALQYRAMASLRRLLPHLEEVD